MLSFHSVNNQFRRLVRLLNWCYWIHEHKQANVSHYNLIQYSVESADLPMFEPFLDDIFSPLYYEVGPNKIPRRNSIPILDKIGSSAHFWLPRNMDTNLLIEIKCEFQKEQCSFNISIRPQEGLMPKAHF